MLRILACFTLHMRPVALLLLTSVLLSAGCHVLPTRDTGASSDSNRNTRSRPVPRSEAEQLAQQAEAYEQQQQFLPALDALLAQAPLLMDDVALRRNSRNVWRMLSQMHNEDFSRLMRREQGQLLGGWVGLARIQRLGPDNLEQQAEQLQDWQRQWPLHPANRYLPEDMKLLKRLKEEQPRHIALLLPLSGKRAKAGESVRDGFLASYYQSLAKGAPAVRIDFIDTESSPDLLSLYGSAVASGAKLVVGPLEREQVQVFANEPALAVPMLALNEANNASAPPTLYQFSLNPEEEARQAALTASAAGLRNAFVVSSTDSRDQRLTQSFAQEWQRLGGTVVTQARYTSEQGDYQSVIGQALGHTGPVNPNAPRRTDIDMVFLTGKAREASQVLPALDTYAIDHLPVYGLSHIYNPQSSLRGQDLNGVRFCLTPLQAGQGSLVKEIRQSTHHSTGLEPLYALGADAQNVYRRLALMQANPDMTMEGYTGYLRLNSKRLIERGMLWQMLQSGQPVPLPVPALESDTTPLQTAPAAVVP
jgi:outer membrane PBP1 activator LpoA protein